MRAKTELAYTPVKWAKLAENADVSINTCTYIDAILAPKYSLVDLCEYSIWCANKLTPNCKKSVNIAYSHLEKSAPF